jgi:phasin family protein
MMTKPDSQFFDLYRVSLEAALDIAKASLQGMERLRAHQLKMISEAFSEAADTGQQIGSVKNLEEMLEVQTKLAPAQLEKAMGYWSGLCATTARNQADVMQQMQAKVSSLGDAYRATLDAAPRGSEPMVAPLKSAVNAICSAYALTARASEEAARLAVSQIETANAGMRQTAQAASQAAQAASQSAGEARRKAATA